MSCQCPEHEINLTRHQIPNQGPSRAIGHNGKLRPRLLLKLRSQETENERIHSCRCLVGMSLQPGDQFTQVLRRHRFFRHKNNRTSGKS